MHKAVVIVWPMTKDIVLVLYFFKILRVLPLAILGELQYFTKKERGRTAPLIKVLLFSS